jgi:hypothetical protein
MLINRVRAGNFVVKVGGWRLEVERRQEARREGREAVEESE